MVGPGSVRCLSRLVSAKCTSYTGRRRRTVAQVGAHHVHIRPGALENILGVCIQAAHGVHLLLHGRSLLSVGPQESGQSPPGRQEPSGGLCLRLFIYLFIDRLFFSFFFYI